MSLKIKASLLYLIQFSSSPRTIGTVMPSSVWLCRAMIKTIDWSMVKQIAELGAGDGVLTRHILSVMAADAQLTAYEINDDFAQQLAGITDPRFRLIIDSAETLLGNYQVIFCCLPLLTLHKRVTLRILRQIHRQLLATQGQLVLFQYISLSEKLLSRYFVWRKQRVLFNLPPAWVYYCQAKR